MSDSGSIQAFGAGDQNKPELRAEASTQSTQESDTASSIDAPSFVKDVELLACGKVNQLDFSTSRHSEILTPESLRSRRQSRPYSVARQFAWFLLYHHPYAMGLYATPQLGKRYGRDHTTVLSGLQRIESYIRLRKAHPLAVAVQEICDQLAPRYGDFSPWRHYGLPDPRPKKDTLQPHPEPEPVSRKSVDVIGTVGRDQEIIRLRKKGYEAENLAERFGVAIRTIWDLTGGRR